jgi:hypothetical protein
MGIASNAWLFTFPFWMIVDTSAAPMTMEGVVSGCYVRAYSPFRSAPADFVYAPRVYGRSVPFAAGISINVGADEIGLLTLAALPTLEQAPDGTPGVLLAWGEQWTTRPRNFPMDSLRPGLR